ncbi:Uncharacterized protein HZ326_7888 [Fusarium oxysporum f. sp. albedinis]|nr:Uncharacterized protein HZ326_7888 [Fusarium oxysporum f. sp. albedinis]
MLPRQKPGSEKLKASACIVGTCREGEGKGISHPSKHVEAEIVILGTDVITDTGETLMHITAKLGCVIMTSSYKMPSTAKSLG